MSLNRAVAFLGPYVAVISGVITDWLVVHLHLLAIFHVGKSIVASTVSQAIVFSVTSLIVWLGHQKWLSGWIEWEKHNVQPIIEKVEPAPLPTQRAK